MRASRSQQMKSIPSLLERVSRFLVILAIVGLLNGCSESYPLAVASGPVFPLNSGHWQPTPQDLAAPPSVAGR